MADAKVSAVSLSAVSCANPSCEQQASGLRCSRCKAASYCSADCQKRHWQGGDGPRGPWGHRLECKPAPAQPKKLDTLLPDPTIGSSSTCKEASVRPLSRLALVIVLSFFQSDEPLPLLPPLLPPLSQVDQALEVVERFGAPVAEVWGAFTDEAKITKYTGARARFPTAADAPFSLMDGAITGHVVRLQPLTMLQMKWRMTSWPPGAYSTANLTFDEEGTGGTTVTLKQDGIPLADAFGNVGLRATVSAGWQELFFGRIRRVLGLF
jgi:uncharacterized protein YndB with AHSA1/START domain